MKFLVGKEARSPYRKGKIIAAQTEDLKPSPRNKRERKHFHKRNPKENKTSTRNANLHTPGNEFKSASKHLRTSTKPDRYSPVLHEEKQTNKSSEVCI
jgi:dipeptidase